MQRVKREPSKLGCHAERDKIVFPQNFAGVDGAHTVFHKNNKALQSLASVCMEMLVDADQHRFTWQSGGPLELSPER